MTQTVVVAIDNVSVADFEDNPDLFPETRKIFEDAVEMTNPRSDGFNLGFALAYTPLSLATKRRIRLGTINCSNLPVFLTYRMHFQSTKR